MTSISFAPGDAAASDDEQRQDGAGMGMRRTRSVIERLILRGHTEAVGSGVFSPQGDKIVTAGDDLTVRSWTLLPVLREWKGANVASAAYSADGKHIWAAGSPRPVRKEGRVTYDGFWVSKLSEATLLARRGPRVHATQPTFYGSRIVDADRTGRLNVRDVRTPAEVHPRGRHPHTLWRLSLPRSGVLRHVAGWAFGVLENAAAEGQEGRGRTRSRRRTRSRKTELGSTLVWNLSTPFHAQSWSRSHPGGLARRWESRTTGSSPGTARKTIAC